MIYILHSVDVIAAILREFQAPLGKRRKVIDAYEAPSDARLLWKRMACLRARLCLRVRWFGVVVVWCAWRAVVARCCGASLCLCRARVHVFVLLCIALCC